MIHSSIASVLLLAASTATLSQGLSYDCGAGCRTDSSTMGNAVCGDDGISYFNECLAVCQNVAVASLGPCSPADDGRHSNSFQRVDFSGTSMNYDETQVITEEAMNKFSQEKFRLVGKVLELTPPDLTTFDNILDDDDETQQEDDEDDLSYFRITREGYQYAATVDASDVDENVDSTPVDAHVGNAERFRVRRRRLRGAQNHRDLVVVGDDTREMVADTTAFPFSAMAQVDVTHISQGGCTATMIAPSKALTAAHCVFSLNDNLWFDSDKVAPGRYRDEEGNTVDPFGTWDIEHATVFRGYIRRGSKNLDIAVLHLAPRIESDGSEVEAGDVVGYVGLAKTTRLGRELQRAKIIGYPGDKPLGEQWKSEDCERFRWGGDGYRYHKCDVTSGNSGSSILGHNNRAYGVHAYGYRDRNNNPLRNGAVVMKGRLFRTIKLWAGYSNNRGGDPISCPCDGIRGRIARNTCMALFVRRCRLSTESN